MNNNILENIEQMQEAVRLMLEIDKVNVERDGEIMDTYDDIPNNLRKFNDLCRVFNKFEEFDGGLPSSEEFEKLLAKALGKKEIHYYEVFIGSEDDYGFGEQPSFVIMGIRKPTVEEANEFCKVDCYRCGGKITKVETIDKEEIGCSIFPVGDGPVFGKDKPLTLEDVFGKFKIFWKGKEKIVFAQSPAAARAAFNKTLHAFPCLICDNDKFVVAIHGGLEPVND